MAGKFLTNWGDDENKALTEWIARAAALGIDITTVRPILRGGARESVRASSDSVAVREALKHAASCRCRVIVDGKPMPIPHDVTIPAGTVAVLPPVTVTLGSEPATNPLRALREAAKLTQREAADALGIARRTVQIQEASAAPSAALVAKARKVLGKAGAK